MTPASAPPTWLSVETSGLPADLTEGCSFVVWKAEPRKGKVGEWEKAPRRSDTLQLASTTDPRTWSAFGDAFTAYERHPELTGIGRIMQHDDGIVGLDLDKSVNPDRTVKPWAQEIVDALPGAYWELSPSGKGLRGFCLGKLPPGRRKRTYQDCSIEIYDDVRHLTLTGHAVRGADRLPNLQEHVEAVHARWFAGGEASEGAIATGRTGRAESVTSEGLAVLERMMGGKYGSQMLAVWAGKTDSDQDWALACEAAYHALELGYSGDRLGQVVEDVMRGGPYRPKWDRPYTVTVDGKTVQTTWLGRTIGRAIGTVQKRRAKSSGQPTDDLHDLEQLPPKQETAEQKIARLERELAHERTLRAADQTTIMIQRERLAELRERLDGWKTVLSNPKLKPADRIVALPIIEAVEAARKTGQDAVHVRMNGISHGWGIPDSTVAKSAAVLTEMPAAVLAKHNERDRLKMPDPDTGQGTIVTPLKTIVRATIEGSLYAAIGSYDPGLPTRGGKRHPLEHCADHPDADLIVRHVKQCSVCRHPVGEPKETVLRLQNEALGAESPPAVDERIFCRQNEGLGGHDGDGLAERAVAMVATDTGRDVDAWKRLQTKLPIDFEAIREARERAADPDPPDWLEEWPDEPVPAPAPKLCLKSDCWEPSANGFVCALHLRGDPLPAAVRGAEE